MAPRVVAWSENEKKKDKIRWFHMWKWTFFSGFAELPIFQHPCVESQYINLLDSRHQRASLTACLLRTEAIELLALLVVAFLREKRGECHDEHWKTIEKLSKHFVLRLHTVLSSQMLVPNHPADESKREQWTTPLQPSFLFRPSSSEAIEKLNWCCYLESGSFCCKNVLTEVTPMCKISTQPMLKSIQKLPAFPLSLQPEVHVVEHILPGFLSILTCKKPQVLIPSFFFRELSWG